MTRIKIVSVVGVLLAGMVLSVGCTHTDASTSGNQQPPKQDKAYFDNQIATVKANSKIPEFVKAKALKQLEAQKAAATQ